MEHGNLDQTRSIPAAGGDSPEDMNAEEQPTSGAADTRAIPVAPLAGAASGGEGALQPAGQADTVATPVQPPSTEPGGPQGPSLPLGGGSGQPRQPHLWRWLIALSIAMLFLVAAASAIGGYYSGIQQRTRFEATQVAGEVSRQFELGLQDMQSGRFEVARQRFEYVIRLDPAYPGVTERLAEVLLELNTTATPTAIPTPTLTPTVDLRSAEELFSQAQVLLADERWSEAIDTLLKLRKDEPGYKTVEVDSMLYVALRNRGVHRILNEADLEGGTYDLALAERFGPLDVEASNMRNWADLYVTGASFWGLDWGQAAYFFGQLVPVAPNLRDRSNLTAGERFRQASIKYGDFLAENGEWCQALEQYEIALDFGSDPAVEPTASWVADECAEADSGEEEEEEEQPTESPPPSEATPIPTEPPPAEPSPTPEAPPPTEGYPAPTP